MIGVANGDMGEGEGKRFSLIRSYFLPSLREMGRKTDRRRVIHSVKLGLALVFVSLLYLINPMFKQVGENAMWAIMTVVVMFEFYAGFSLSFSLTRESVHTHTHTHVCV